MRVFLAGATGVIGLRLVPLLRADGHAVAGMTRSPEKTDTLRRLGAEPVVCDVFDSVALTSAVNAFSPELVMHQLTDLPDELDQLPDYWERNDRVRTEGTRNLVDAAQAAGASRLLAQSIAWQSPGREKIVEEHERLVLDAGGVVIRYGQLYGPGTFYEHEMPAHPRIHVDEAAAGTIRLLNARPGIISLVEDHATSSV
jgi:nucleoside-diphosphate-sugar epimerase